jgi:Domain of Unknown Function (DUF928)
MIRLIHFTLGLGLLGVLGGVNVPIVAQTTAPRSSQPLPPPPPSTPPPNSTRSGGSLGASSTCDNPTQTDSPRLIALVPIENPVLTTSAHPTFLFYVPYGSKQVKFGEFSILTGSAETTRLYRTRFTLPETPGVVSISLPSDSEAIAKDVFYHWYFKLYCQENTSSRADLEVNGWVKRVEPIAAQSHQTAMPVAWYDAIADLGDRLRTSPQDTALKNRWRALLTLIHTEDLADKPLVGSVHPLEN